MGREHPERDPPHEPVANPPELRGEKFLVVAIAVAVLLAVVAALLVALPFQLPLPVLELVAPVTLFFVMRPLGHEGVAARACRRVKTQAEPTESQYAVPPTNMRHVHLSVRTRLSRRRMRNRSGGWSRPSGSPGAVPFSRSTLLGRDSFRGYYCSLRTPWIFSLRSLSRRGSSVFFFLRRSRRLRCGCRSS